MPPETSDSLDKDLSLDNDLKPLVHHAARRSPSDAEAGVTSIACGQVVARSAASSLLVRKII